jgi:hypothetical protein
MIIIIIIIIIASGVEQIFDGCAEWIYLLESRHGHHNVYVLRVYARHVL